VKNLEIDKSTPKNCHPEQTVIPNKLSSLKIVIPTGASHSRREWEAEWRDLLFPFAIHAPHCDI
jgi:hypothetical protein